MQRPKQLREQSRLYEEMAEREDNTHIKRKLASHALALAHLAEKIESDNAAPESSAA
jgi:hypothetical protein